MKRLSLLFLLVVARFGFAQNMPVFSIQPTNQTVSLGTTATFAAMATGAASYQWLFNGANIFGATNATLQVGNVQATNSGYYAVLAKNSIGWVPSSMAYLFVDYTQDGAFPNSAGMLPFSNTNNFYFQGDIEWAGAYSGSPGTPTNGNVQIWAGPELDQMQPLGQKIPYRFSPVSSRFYNGYFNALDQPVSIIKPGQIVYYSVLCKYTNNGTAYEQPSTIMKLAVGTNGLPAPAGYGLKFPVWFAVEGLEPSFIDGSSTNQLRVVGETFSITNTFFAYTDYGTPTAQWRKNGTPIPGATNFPNISPGYSGPQVVSGVFQAVLRMTNSQPADAGVYDLVVHGNSWLVSRKTALQIQANNGQGVLQNGKLVGNNFICELAGAAGRAYTIQQSTNLFDWTDIVTLSNLAGTVVFTNQPTQTGAHFYRSVLVP
ncbi:MAG: immunoglobulin domain-containing protein [Verrucomicrobiota bacterium]